MALLDFTTRQVVRETFHRNGSSLPFLVQMKFPTLNLFHSREGEEENTIRNDVKEIEIRTGRFKGEEKLEKREYEKFIINLTTGRRCSTRRVSKEERTIG